MTFQMPELKSRFKPNEYTVAAGPAGMAEGQSVTILVAMQFATHAMLEMLNASDPLTPQAVEYYLTLKKLRERIDEELREVDAALELAEQKVTWV